jgi:hypothetical protein
VVEFFYPREVALERLLEPVGQEGDTLAHSFGFAHANLSVSKIDIFHTQSQAFEETQTASVEKVDHQAVIAFYVGKHGPRFRSGKDDRHFRRSLCAFDVVEKIEFSFEDLLVEEEQGGESLVLGRGSDLFFDCEEGEKSADLLFTHLAGMAFPVEENEAADPIEVSLLGADAVMLEAQMPANAVQELRTGDGRRWGSDHWLEGDC